VAPTPSGREEATCPAIRWIGVRSKVEVMSTVGARPHPSLRRYTTELARHRVRVVPGAAGTVWTGYESGSIRRLPLFHVAPPVRGEIRRALWCGRATVAGYLLAPDARHPANGWLYICTDRDYALAQRPAAFRRAVRQGLTHCRIARLTPDELLAHGFPAFHDTRCRHGLSDGTLERHSLNTLVLITRARRWFHRHLSTPN